MSTISYAVLAESRDTILRSCNSCASRPTKHNKPITDVSGPTEHDTPMIPSQTCRRAQHTPSHQTPLNFAGAPAKFVGADVGCVLCSLRCEQRVQRGMLCSLSRETQQSEARTIVSGDLPSITHRLYVSRDLPSIAHQ